MLNRTIKISGETHEDLSSLAFKNDTFNDVIVKLIKYYRENEEFSDEQASRYNKEIELFEDGVFDNVTELTLAELDERISKLEAEIKK